MTEAEPNRVTGEEREFILTWAREWRHGVMGPVRRKLGEWGFPEIEMSGLVRMLRLTFDEETAEAEKEPTEVGIPWATAEEFRERTIALAHRAT